MPSAIATEGSFELNDCAGLFHAAGADREVEATWRAACRRRAEIQAAIAENLPPETTGVKARAEWIMQTVDRLAPLLVRPTQLCVAAKAMAEQRGAVTSADLVADRDALLEALHHVLGSQSEPTLTTWHQAFGLFADIIAAFIVNPFCG